VTLSLQVGRYRLDQAEQVDLRDPRGIVWVFEEPRPNANYVVSCDPSYGIASWSRHTRTEDDIRTDNCAVEVVRIGDPDVQVAEYAAPIDPEDAAAVVNFLGRMYGGAHEDGQALAIVEVHPGPGLLTQRELINRYGYLNLFLWQHLDKMVVQQTQAFGWYSSRQSRQMLWIRGTRHLNQRKIVINSPWLVEEMTDCVLDNFLSFTARAQWGAHDDRMVATLMAIWAANQWSFDNPPEEQAKPVDANMPDYQFSDCTAEEMTELWNEKMERLIG